MTSKMYHQVVLQSLATALLYNYFTNNYNKIFVCWQISRTELKASHLHKPSKGDRNCTMFIGRVYEHHKVNKKTKNVQQQSQLKRQCSLSSSSDDEKGVDRLTKYENSCANVANPSNNPDRSVQDDRSNHHDVFIQQGNQSLKEMRFYSVNNLIKDNNPEESNTYTNCNTTQVTYSIPTTHFETGFGKRKTENNNSKHEFDAVNLDSGDEKKSVGVQATPYPPYRLRILPHPDWQVSFGPLWYLKKKNLIKHSTFMNHSVTYFISVILCHYLNVLFVTDYY